jgi:FkbM family methyltransferase
MGLLSRLVHAHLRSRLRGKTRVTLALAARSPELQQVPIQVNGARPLFLDLRDASNHDLFGHSPHARAPCQWTTDAAYRHLVRPGDTVLDVGANRGLHAVSFATMVGAGGRVICFEPNPALLPCLEKTVAATPWMTLLPVALSDFEGSATLFVGASHEMGSLGNWVAERSGETTGQVTVRTARLDTLVAEGAVPRPDVIKIDVEGNELRVLRGSAALLNREDAPVLVYEANLWAAPIATGEPSTAATGFLLDLDQPQYRCFFLWDWGLVTRLERNQLVHGDIVAIPAARTERWPSLVSEGMYELAYK